MLVSLGHACHFGICVATMGSPRLVDWVGAKMPIRYLQCGDGWQSEYAALHAATLRGELPPRYLVVQGINGLADSMVAAVSMLYLAVLQVGRDNQNMFAIGPAAQALARTIRIACAYVTTKKGIGHAD